MIYIVDVDNTICYSPDSDYTRSVPYKWRIDEINRLYEEGHTIIYWTARGGRSGIDWTEHTKKQLEEWGCQYSDLRMGKPSYDYWIDDKAFNSHDFFDD